MSDSSIVSWVANGLMGIVVWFMKSTVGDIKAQLHKQEDALEKVKETYQKKTDFTEFKAELWARLDKMEHDFQRALDKK